MDKILPYDETYIFTFFEDPDIKVDHPLSEYFLSVGDLSINLLISLKWLNWGYFFLESLSKELNKASNIEEYLLSNIIDKSIIKSEIYIKREELILIVDDLPVNNRGDLDKMINDFYSMNIFDENSKVHMKLKINLSDYLIISNLLYPSLMKVVSK